MQSSDSKRPSESDAAAARYFLLDMGKEKFGDCILCLVGGQTILIDGGHPGDFDGQPTSASIPDQIGAILEADPPYDIDLLVVTHCHLDHIGCLPKMVKEGVLNVRWALVADEKLGWGKRIAGPDSDVLPDAPVAARVVAALREEPRADDFERDEDIERFLQDAVTLEQSYKTMLATLTGGGTTVVRYGRDSHQPVETEFAAAQLEILGPTGAHLEICRQAIASSMQDAVADTVALANSDAASSDVELYRALSSTRHDAVTDGDRLGAALNDQSIILALGPDSSRVLLTADMQFADPAVPGLDEEMTALREVVAQAGPYKVVKLAHHGSHNGLDESVRADWAGTRLFAISGGSNDPTHPARPVLTLLKNEQDHITWARTDKNGQIEIRPSAATPFTISKGSLNNGAVNPKPPKPRDAGAAAVAEPPRISETFGGGVLEVTARIPSHLKRVVISIDSELRDAVPRAGVAGGTTRPSRSEPARAVERSTDRSRIGGGRPLPPLLFVSSLSTLASNIGRAEADAAVKLIEQSGQTYLDVSGAADPADAVRRALGKDHKGVVLLGGYDVLPAKRLDTLPAEVRTRLGDRSQADFDDFIVWSDAIYGDADGDDLPEIPVSRVPDGKSGELVLSALRSPGINTEVKRFAILNAKRPFAADILDLVRGDAAALISLPATVDDVDATATEVPLVYFMLHGFDGDGTRFAGQEPEYPDSFDIDQVPAAGSGVVFTGCCWGALTVRQLASRVVPARALTPRTADQSIALRFLKAGYTAFVGCTGSHYSPPDRDLTHGKPMHVGFWEQLNAGRPPADALFAAKIQYLRDMPHGMDDLWDIAVEHKTLRQFTCLGLGW
jgi:beta-lactamase superfamily II metal-dependent hydrolase